MVLGGGLEPPRVAPHAPQTCVSAIPPPEHRRAKLMTWSMGVTIRMKRLPRKCVFRPEGWGRGQGAAGRWWRVGVVAMGDGWAGAAERGFRLNFAGAKTNRRLFRAAASRPVTDGHESSPDRPQSGIIEKSGGYFCEEPRQNLNESLYTMSCGRRARGGRLREGP